MTLNELNGTECSTEIIKKINDIIAQKASISLNNLDAAGELRFETLAQGIRDVNDLVVALTAVVNTKISAEVSLQQNGYIKFSNGFIIQHGYSVGVNNHTQQIYFPIACSWVSLFVSQEGTVTLSQNLSTHSFSNTWMYVTTNDSSVNLPPFYWLVVGSYIMS